MASLWHLSEFQPVSRLGFVTAPTSLNGGQPNFARCLGLLPHKGMLPRAKFTASKSCVLLYWQRYCTALEHCASAKHCGSIRQRTPPVFGWTAITLVIGPHCSLFFRFGRPFVKRFALCYRTVMSVLSVTLVYCGQTVARIKMKLGMQAVLGPGHIVLDGDPDPPPRKGHSPHPIFGPYLLRPNGCMDQDATWYGARP